MIEIENIEVFGFETAIRGMRNPLNSWDKSDSYQSEFTNDGKNGFVIGKNDLALMKKLVRAGSDHRKFLRMINVTMDIVAPLYWWKEFDTYKVGTVANSCSTMHKIHDKEFTLADFSCENLHDTSDKTATNVYANDEGGYDCWGPFDILCLIIDSLNHNRKKFIETKNKDYWWQMIQLLPSSYNQRRTVQLNYETLRNMYFARKNHKLDEWQRFCAQIETLFYFKEICLEEGDE